MSLLILIREWLCSGGLIKVYQRAAAECLIQRGVTTINSIELKCCTAPQTFVVHNGAVITAEYFVWLNNPFQAASINQKQLRNKTAIVVAIGIKAAHPERNRI